jgi:hypothetical protein
MQEGNVQLAATMEAKIKESEAKIQNSNAATQAAMASALSAIMDRLDKLPPQSGSSNEMVKVTQTLERMVPSSQVGAMATAARIAPRQNNDFSGFDEGDPSSPVEGSGISFGFADRSGNTSGSEDDVNL